jgi:hypothetical protein
MRQKKNNKVKGFVHLIRSAGGLVGCDRRIYEFLSIDEVLAEAV